MDIFSLQLSNLETVEKPVGATGLSTIRGYLSSSDSESTPSPLLVSFGYVLSLHISFVNLTTRLLSFFSHFQGLLASVKCTMYYNLQQ